MKIEIYGYDQEKKQKFTVMTVDTLEQAMHYLKIIRTHDPDRIFKWKLIEER